jgi:hypothetical protein
MLGAAAGVMRLMRAHRRLRRELADRRPIAPALHRALVQRTGIGGDIALGVSGAVRSPLVWDRSVVLPVQAITDFTIEQLACVFAHEVAHIRRRDVHWRWIVALVQRVFFVQPLNRLATHRLRELAECSCDDFAVERTGSPVVLASALGAVAAWLRHIPRGDSVAGAPAMLASGGESLVVKRVRRILVPSRPSTLTPSVFTQLLACTATCATLIALAPRVRGVAGAPNAAVTVYTISAEDPAGKFTVMLHGARVVGVTIDGRALPRERIDQRGAALRLIEDNGTAFTLELTAAGGLHWQPRPPRAATVERLAT